ncbi:MAG: tRNA guanosine(34) transglycosylase Tgt [Tepidisphaeraceae bacterium]|jgi:queuine tRNA-ribosyltransferase
MQSNALKFEVMRSDAPGARLGRVTTRHGAFDTPAFMPVGTQGSIKGVLPDHVAATGAQIILANTYHLMLRPGEKTVAELGGLHRFMGWDGPILTDSGGFQVFSLAEINRITDDGVWFKSHVDGSDVFLDAARSIAVQNDLGADIVMAFDQCPPASASPEAHRQAVDRTLRWAEQSLASHKRRDEQSLFGIVQGGTDLDLRTECARRLSQMEFSGFALGGLAVGEGFAAMTRVLDHLTPILPDDKPRYLMGVGYPRDIVSAVAAGVDMFDCVLPTRNGRNAYAFTAGGPLRLRNSGFQRDSRPIEDGCDCYACRRFSRGAIRHFFFAGEMLGPILVSVHNIRFYQRLMADVRGAIAEGTFQRFRTTDPRAKLGPSESADEKSADGSAPDESELKENG